MKIYAAACVFLLGAGVGESVTNATWAGVASSNWDLADTTNWTPNTVPQAAGDIANLTAAGTNPLTTITSNIIVGTINFSLPAGYTIALGGGSLTLQSTSNAAIGATTSGDTGAYVLPAIVLGSPLVVTQNSSGGITLSGQITESPAGQTVTLASASTQTLTLSSGSANTYTGGTVINGGTLSISNDNQLGTGGNVSIGSGTLQFTATTSSARTYTLTTGAAKMDVSGAAMATLSGLINGVGPFTLDAASTGTLILSNTVPNTYTLGTFINGGTLSISNDNQLGAAGTEPVSIGTATLQFTATTTSARAYTLTTGSANIDVSGAAIATLSGAINGTGPLTLDAASTGTLILNGINGYTAGTVINGGTLSISADTNLGTLATPVTIANTGTLLFSAPMTTPRPFTLSNTPTISAASGTALLSGALTGGGTLAVQGGGTLALSGTNSYTGPTTITGSTTLNVTGSLTSAATINGGSTLSGTGTLGNTTNSGTIAPGNGDSTGTLHITGTLTSTPGIVDITLTPLTADQIAVTGSATITGSTLIVEPLPGFYGFSSVSYPILTTTTGLTGTFSIPAVPGFSLTASYAGGNNCVLLVQVLDPFLAFPFSNKNTRAVGENLEALALAGEISSDLLSILVTFIGQDFAEINFALDQMHPAQLSAVTELQAELEGQILSLFHRKPYLNCSCEGANRLWIEPFGNTLTLKRHGIEIGAQSNSAGVAFGYDGAATDSLTLGLGGAWSCSKLHWHNHRGHSEINGFYGGLYADWCPEHLYIGLAGLAGTDFYETSRHIDFITTDRHARSDTMALDIMGGVAAAYFFGTPQAVFYPYANVDCLYLRTHKFHEHGADGLNLGVKKRIDSTLRTEMGLAFQMQDTNAAETMCISPKFGIGWVNMSPLKRDLYTATFEGATIPFKTYGWKETWNLLHLDLGLAVTYYCHSFGLEYSADISPDSETLLFNQHGNLHLDWKW